MKHWKIIVTLVAAAGGVAIYFAVWGGASPPDIATVKKQMSPDQLELGDPIANSIGMILVPIPAGEFLMGTPMPKSKKPGNLKSEMPPHRVKITKSFYISAFEVTQGQYEQVMGERPWDGQPLVKIGPHFAASYISWENAVAFCEKLSKQEGESYRLPTEAEWEYACRAGSTTAFSFGNDGAELPDFAWFDQNAYKKGKQYPHVVGQKLPNAWGLYDMHGNIWEWCNDWYGGYDGSGKDAVEPTGPRKGRFRVWRGGGFSDPAINARSATRLSFGRANYRPEFATGFRVVREFNN